VALDRLVEGLCIMSEKLVEGLFTQDELVGNFDGRSMYVELVEEWLDVM